MLIRTLTSEDYDAVCKIVNDNWREVYAGYVNPELLNDFGCRQREINIKKDFLSSRLSEYVLENEGKVVALLSFGNTEDEDKAGAFEIWRIYISQNEQGKGFGDKLISFAEQEAERNGYKEIIIWAFKGNVRAISFYLKHGYIMDREKDLGAPYMAIGVRMTKDL
ncbi:GNAT family N-acetyltransferase [Clostridium transplantifaecale]|uniref:GNAT family N-acetyltransferase n=1 Tax=Clostridium transplantifaecale TaxID=2479838 RepID=UPI000F638D27|nr:GNAT family N-acetyltransferase [Clostridium transplantifaecale]